MNRGNIEVADSIQVAAVHTIIACRNPTNERKSWTEIAQHEVLSKPKSL